MYVCKKNPPKPLKQIKKGSHENNPNHLKDFITNFYDIITICCN